LSDFVRHFPTPKRQDHFGLEATIGAVSRHRPLRFRVAASASKRSMFESAAAPVALSLRYQDPARRRQILDFKTMGF
jgi:hypothetical protein